ncbi:MAG TPA: hypothetical protein VJ757_00250 [Pseudonocardiaceae bacterium]|nr:hypothetical protein [Pseudonocardiaceae bacterium]
MAEINLDPQVPVPGVVYTKAKAFAATVTTALGVVALFVADIADGALSWSEGGTLIGAVATAAATIAAVWRVPNDEVKAG